MLLHKSWTFMQLTAIELHFIFYIIDEKLEHFDTCAVSHYSEDIHELYHPLLSAMIADMNNNLFQGGSILEDSFDGQENNMHKHKELDAHRIIDTFCLLNNIIKELDMKSWDP
ncbi:hypothetical protein ACJX0J_018567 [Zea mays]